MKRLIIFAIITLLLPSLALADGGDQIFEEIGMDKPSEWNSWSRTERFDYLASLGLSPGKNGKYQGDAGDLTEYFNLLGLEEPSNWNSMSFDEKKAYVNSASESTDVTSETSGSSSSNISSSANTEETNDVIEGVSTSNEESSSEENEEIITTTNTSSFFENNYDLFIDLLLVIGIFIFTLSFSVIAVGFRKVSSKLVYYLLPLILLVSIVFYPERAYFAFLGNLAEGVLIFLLFVKPLAKLFNSRILQKIVVFRRQLGIATFWLFLFHAGGLIHLLNLISLSNYSFYVKPHLFFALVASIGLVLLTVTSNNVSIKLMKKNWKRLQYLAYPILFAVLAHSSLVSTGNLVKFYIVCGSFLVLKLLELKK